MGRSSKGACRRADRKEGWTEAKKKAFLEVLGATCNIAAALRAVGMSRQGLEKLRARDGAFRAAMAEVRRRAYLDLEFFALEKMMNGTVKTVTKADGAVETVHEFPLGQAMHLLRLHRDVAEGAGVPEAESEEAGEERKAEVVERLMRKMRALRARMDREEAAALKATGGGGGVGVPEAGAPAAAAAAGEEAAPLVPAEEGGAG